MLRKLSAVCAVIAVVATSVGTAHAAADGPDFYRVTGVKPADTLRMHSAPSQRTRILARIPHDATGLKNLGCKGGLNFAAWSKATEQQRAAAAAARWCRITFAGKTGWVAGRYLTEGAAQPAVTPPAPAVATPASDRWQVNCISDVCAIEQTGVPSDKRTTLRVVIAKSGEPTLIIERPAWPRSGVVTIYMDGTEVSAGPIAPLLQGSRLVIGPDDISANIFKQMQQRRVMVVSVPDDPRGIEFELVGIHRARGALEAIRPKPAR